MVENTTTPETRTTTSTTPETPTFTLAEVTELAQECERLQQELDALKTHNTHARAFLAHVDDMVVQRYMDYSTTHEQLHAQIEKTLADWPQENSIPMTAIPTDILREFRHLAQGDTIAKDSKTMAARFHHRPFRATVDHLNVKVVETHIEMEVEYRQSHRGFMRAMEYLLNAARRLPYSPTDPHDNPSKGRLKNEFADPHDPANGLPVHKKASHTHYRAR